MLIAKGVHVTQSLEYGFVIKTAGLMFPFIIMLFADRLERKWSVCLSCSAIAAFGLIFAQQTTPGALILLGICLAASTGWLSYALHNYQAELYPTRVRARAIGFVYSWSRLSGILVGFMVAFFLSNFGVPGVFVFVASCMAVWSSQSRCWDHGRTIWSWRRSHVSATTCSGWPGRSENRFPIVTFDAPRAVSGPMSDTSKPTPVR